MNTETELAAMWRSIQFIQDAPAKDFTDNLTELFEGFYSLFETITDKLDEMETKVEELEGIVLQQQIEIKDLQEAV